MLHPGIIALLTGSGITLVLLCIAAVLGLKILRSWDMASSSEEQLLLERRTYLVSTLVQYGLLFEVVSTLLFVYTADDIHSLLVGAMCATGSLNANAYGFPALYAKMATMFLAAAWVAVNHLDNKAEDYPLTRRKYGLLLLMLPFLIAGYFLQIKYFSLIAPNVITSCCGALFSEGDAGLASSLASLPVRQTEIVFYSLFAILAVSGIAAMRTGRRLYTVALSLASAAFFFVSIAAIISFISLYFYQIPTHHCPFDILQAEYYYAGYPLYAALFTGCFFGMMTGVVEPLKKVQSLSGMVPGIQKKWALLAVSAATVFMLITLLPMIFSSFTLEGY